MPSYRIGRRRGAPHQPADAILALVLTVLVAVSPLASADHHVRPPEPRPGVEEPFTNPDPGGQLWRDVRGAVSGTSQARGMDAGVLIDDRGEAWQTLRTEKVYRYAATFLGVMLGLVALYHLLHGGIPLAEGRAGQTIKRWAGWERALHWYVASLFVVLALTGLALMFGKHVLIPVLGREVFGTVALVSKNLHNYLGPAFVLGVLVMIVAWIRHNFPKWVDVLWVLKGGGLFGSAHPSAGRMNGGEKGWFWFIASVGLVACASGLVLNFPDLVGTRSNVQLANIIHIASTIAWVGGFFGHAYIGTLGSEGSIEGMVTGEVDVNWAKQHHDLWYAEEAARAAGAGEAAPELTEAEHRPA